MSVEAGKFYDPFTRVATYRKRLLYFSQTQGIFLFKLEMYGSLNVYGAPDSLQSVKNSPTNACCWISHLVAVGSIIMYLRGKGMPQPYMWHRPTRVSKQVAEHTFLRSASLQMTGCGQSISLAPFWYYVMFYSALTITQINLLYHVLLGLSVWWKISDLPAAFREIDVCYHQSII